MSKMLYKLKAKSPTGEEYLPYIQERLVSAIHIKLQEVNILSKWAKNMNR